MKCKIIDGTFIDSDGSLKSAGQTIELDEDMANVHRGRIRPMTEEELAEEAGATPVAEGAPATVQAPALADAGASVDVDAEHH